MNSKYPYRFGSHVTSRMAARCDKKLVQCIYRVPAAIFADKVEFATMFPASEGTIFLTSSATIRPK